MSLPPIDLNHLPVLHALIETRSVTLTARRLGISQPTVSRALGRLREVLADPLLVKHGHQMICTKRAEALKSSLDDWFSASRRLFNTHEEFRESEIEGCFQIASTDFGVLAVLAPAMPRIMSAAPRLQIKVQPLRTNSTRQLMTGGVDIVLTGFGIEPDRTYQRWLFDEALACVMEPDHPLAKTSAKEPLAFEDLAAWPHYTAVAHADIFDEVDVAMASMGIRRHVALRIPYFAVGAHLLVGTSALLVLPIRAAEHFGRSCGLAYRELPRDQTKFSYHIVWSERARRDPATEWLIEQLANQFVDIEGSRFKTA